MTSRLKHSMFTNYRVAHHHNLHRTNYRISKIDATATKKF
jgi:hypothetical protein